VLSDSRFQYTCHLEGQLGWEEKGHSCDYKLPVVRSIIQMDTVSCFNKTVKSVEEEKKTWQQSVVWDDLPILPNFSFPLNYTLAKIKALFVDQKVKCRTENQRTESYFQNESVVDVERISFICSCKFKKNS
jgi:hypothetical protein